LLPLVFDELGNLAAEVWDFRRLTDSSER
jgi:hypothetical protein